MSGATYLIALGVKISMAMVILLAFAANALGDQTSMIILIVLALCCSLIPVFCSYLIYKKKN